MAVRSHIPWVVGRLAPRAACAILLTVGATASLSQEGRQDTPVQNTPPPDLDASPPNLGNPKNPFACRFSFDGAFQPVQSVYQDDVRDGFKTAEYDDNGPQPNPLIEKIGKGEFTAHLPLIAGRYTVVTGVQRYMENGDPVEAHEHNEIQFILNTNCQDKKKVRVRFQVTADGKTQTFYSDKTYTVHIGGQPNPDGKSVAEKVTLDSPRGLPSSPGRAFTLSGNDYEIRAELLDGKNILTPAITVSGPIKSIPKLRVQFVPVILGNAAQGLLPAFKEVVGRLATASKDYIPDYYPLPPDGLKTWTREILDLSAAYANETAPEHDLPDAERIAKGEDFTSKLKDEMKGEIAEAKIANQLGEAGDESKAQRVIAVLRYGKKYGNDFERATGSTHVLATTVDTKVIMMAQLEQKPGPFSATTTGDYEPPVIGDRENYPVLTVAHELVHTLPAFRWDVPQMETACGTDYHGANGTNQADGLRVVLKGNPKQRFGEDAKIPLMGRAAYVADKAKGEQEADRKWILDKWITQCTYAHLILALKQPVDPQLLLVRGIIGRPPGLKPFGELQDFYDKEGDADVKAGPIKDWGIRVRDFGGGVLATFPFDPNWFADDDQDRILAPLFIRVPRVPGAALVEIVSDSNVVVSKPLSAVPPSLTLDFKPPAPGAGGNRVPIAWQAAGANGQPVKSSVYYSFNDGDFFNDQMFESAAKSADVVIDRKYQRHAIKIVVTDGSRSTSQTVRFQTQ